MGAAGLFAIQLLHRNLNKRELKRWTKDSEAHRASHEQRLLHKRRDTQLNWGRRVFNWIVVELPLEKANAGVRVRKIEDNNGSFSIVIERLITGDTTPVPILQIDYDFKEKTEGYVAHIFYGAYGPDALLYVVPHNPFYGLEKLVMQEVRCDGEKYLQSRAVAS